MRHVRSSSARTSGSRRIRWSARRRSSRSPRRRSGRSSSSTIHSVSPWPSNSSLTRSRREGRRAESSAALERALAHAEAAGDHVVRRHIDGRFCRGILEGPTPAAEAIDRLEEFRSSHTDDPMLDAGVTRLPRRGSRDGRALRGGPRAHPGGEPVPRPAPPDRLLFADRVDNRRDMRVGGRPGRSRA